MLEETDRHLHTRKVGVGNGSTWGGWGIRGGFFSISDARIRTVKLIKPLEVSLEALD